MAYIEYRYYCGQSIDHEVHWAGRYGAKGEKRAKKEKATPEQIRKQNQWRKKLYMQRLIRMNFQPGDYWMTLKYRKGARPPLGRVRKDLNNFIKRARRAYGKRGSPFRYIYRLEIGKRGGIHIHLLANRIPGEDTDRLARKEWDKTAGSAGIYYDTLSEDGDYSELAAYIVKEPDEEAEKQLCMFDEEERKAFVRYSRSRNLAEPEAEEHVYRRRTVRKLVQEGPAPAPGYYIDKASVRMGANPYTGHSYCYYTEFQLPQTRIKAGCGGITGPPGGVGT